MGDQREGQDARQALETPVGREGARVSPLEGRNSDKRGSEAKTLHASAQASRQKEGEGTQRDDGERNLGFRGAPPRVMNLHLPKEKIGNRYRSVYGKQFCPELGGKQKEREDTSIWGEEGFNKCPDRAVLEVGSAEEKIQGIRRTGERTLPRE